MTMKLAKALKEKNRLVGEVNRLRNILVRENSRESRNTSKINVSEVIEKHTATMIALKNIKSAIAKANIGIYAYIEEMAELKSFITWLGTVNTQDGVVETPNYRGGETMKQEFKAHWKQEDIDRLVKEAQDLISVLQDKVDEYNATVTIEI